MLLSCVVSNSKVRFTVFTNPCLEKYLYEWIGFQKDLQTSQGVFVDRDISAHRRASPFTEMLPDTWVSASVKPGEAALGQWCGDTQLYRPVAASA